MKTIARAFVVSVICIISLVAGAQKGGLGALAQSGVEGPVVVVDLVKFKPDGADASGKLSMSRIERVINQLP